MPLTLLVQGKCREETKETDTPQFQPKAKSQCSPTPKPERIRRTERNSNQTETTSQTHEAKNRATSRKKTNSINLPALLPPPTLRLQTLLPIHDAPITSLRRKETTTKHKARNENTRKRQKNNPTTQLPKKISPLQRIVETLRILNNAPYPVMVLSQSIKSRPPRPPTKQPNQKTADRHN